MFPALEKLLADFQREGLPKWKQMKCTELAMALLAEDLIGNGFIIDIENGKIEWPMGAHTGPPQMKVIGEKEANNPQITAQGLKQSLLMSLGI